MNTIALMWMDIVLISRKEVAKKQEQKQIVEFKIFTLEHLDAYLKRQSWDDMVITEEDAFLLISLFHRTYIQTQLSRG